MSNYSENAIYDAIADGINARVPSCKCYSRYTERIERFPAAFIYPLDVTEPQRSRTLAGDSLAFRWTFEIQLFSNSRNGAKAEVEEMKAGAADAFRPMHFRIVSARQIPGGTNDIYRYVIRIDRIIGEADEMPSDNP